MVISGDLDITAGEWIAYSLMTEDTDERTVSDIYIFGETSQQVVIAFMGFVSTRISVSVLQQSLRSVNTVVLVAPALIPYEHLLEPYEYHRVSLQEQR